LRSSGSKYREIVDNELVDDLIAEQAALDALVAGINEDQWSAATPAAGWSVRDQIAHLAFFDEVARASLAASAEQSFRGLLREVQVRHPAGLTGSPGAGTTGVEVLSWWRTARQAEGDAFAAIDGSRRVPWGPNLMAASSLCTARLMETWAHGLDCFAALGVQPVDTARLRHVCHIIYRAIPHAFRDARLEMPAPLEQLQMELTAPHGDTWRFGPESATQRVTGTAGELARVGVRRLPLPEAATLAGEGPLAQAALATLKAYL
jgi:uncharacterized protein (TIGR03084 family)